MRASTGTPSGSENRSKCQENHGPASIRSGADVDRFGADGGDAGDATGVTAGVTVIQPISGTGASDTLPPTAAASICPPKQIPSTGSPRVIAERANAISSGIQAPVVAVS